MTVKRVEIMAACVRKMKMVTVQTMMVEKVTLSGKGRWNLTYFVYWLMEFYEFISKLFFSADLSYLGEWWVFS
jgi:hypothetical protein